MLEPQSNVLPCMYVEYERPLPLALKRTTNPAPLLLVRRVAWNAPLVVTIPHSRAVQELAGRGFHEFEQAADVVRSASMGLDRVTKFTIKASGPKLAPLFDGTQQVVSITSVPYYSRTIYIPTM